MTPHHSDDPRLWNLGAELDLLGLRAPRTRRAAIKLGALGAAGLALGPSRLQAQMPGPVAAPRLPRSKSVIQIWLWGGPCHIDTFDPKPDAGADYTGPFT